MAARPSTIVKIMRKNNMLVSVETTQGLERRMKVQVPAERIESEVDQRLRKVGKSAKLKGFRPGKAPMKVIRQQYGGEVRRDVVGEVMQQTYAEAIGQEKLRPASNPRIETDEVAEGKDLKYTAVFEVYPEIQIKGLSSIKVNKPTAEIVDQDIDRMLENLRKQRAAWQKVERAASEGDRVIIDFCGRIDGETFDGGSGEKVPIVCGEGQMLPDFEKGLSGISAGESRTFPVVFPDDYKATILAGKAAVFEASCESVEEQVLPELDAEFCTAYGVKEGGLEKLRDEVRQNMQTELDQKIQASLKGQLLDQLLKENPVEIPAALIEEEIHAMQHNAMERLGIEDQSQAPPSEAFTEQARRRVSLGLLINEIIKSQKLEVDKARVAKRLKQIAGGFSDPDQVLQAYTGNPGMMSQVEMMVLEQQAVDWALGQVQQTGETRSFSEIMDFKA